MNRSSAAERRPKKKTTPIETLRQLDLSLLLLLNHLGAEGAVREVIIRVAATGLMYALLGIVFYLGLRRPEGGRVLHAALVSAGVAVLVGKILNQVFERQRPSVAFPDQVRHIALAVRPDSFPSIHATGGFGLIGAVLFGRYRRVGLLMLVLGLLMIAARVAAGVHWPSDVLGGAVLGMATAGFFAWVQRCCWPGLGRRRTAGLGRSPRRISNLLSRSNNSPHRARQGRGRGRTVGLRDCAGGRFPCNCCSSSWLGPRWLSPI